MSTKQTYKWMRPQEEMTESGGVWWLVVEGAGAGDGETGEGRMGMGV